MAQVATTLGTEYLGADHAITGVLVELDIALAHNVPETGPAGAGMKLGFRREQFVAASGANVRAIIFGIDILAGKRPFCPRFAQDVVLLIGELPAPLLICFGNFFHTPNSTSQRARRQSVSRFLTRILCRAGIQLTQATWEQA